MTSLDRQVTQNGLVVNNAMARRIYNGVVEVTVLCDDECGVLDVDTKMMDTRP